jgi:1-acyl-sn-glycerol-3-phosphate acyltransferase
MKGPGAAIGDDGIDRVLEVVRGLAREVGGDRASRAVSGDASLEGDVGLGSLERAELLVRLEAAFGRSFPDALLEAETPRQIAALISTEGEDGGPRIEGGSAPVREARDIGRRYETLCRALALRASDDPARPHAYLEGDEGREETVTYGTLYEEARHFGGGLRDRGVRPGDRVALMLPTGDRFLRAFQGILMAGGVPVPLYPPVRLDRLKDYGERQSGILRDSGSRLLVILEEARPLARILSGSCEVAVADEVSAFPGPVDPPPDDAAAPALIQYTSGSTGRPKGVLLTHANLLANIRAIAAGLSATPLEVGVSWLPLYHDMGLIGSWLFCMVLGYPLALLSPLSFLARPERWLWALHRHRGTLSAAPNFAYDLCARRVPESALEGLDLASWRCALNGAEPVSAETLDRFSRRFSPSGFRREAFLPVYGLAENSVALCFPPVGRGPRVDAIDRAAFEEAGRAEPSSGPNPLRVVSVGAPLPEHDVRIVDASGAPSPERQLGRLLFKGPSATPGYFGNAEATRALAGEDGFLDSGDLAYRADGEIFIAGRGKDLIIRAGRNLVPQEIEEVASAVEGIRKGAVVAFGIADATSGTESLVLVAESRSPRPEAVEAAVRERLASALDLVPDAIVLVKPGAVPKTPNGKVQRSEARELYRSGRLGAPARDPLLTRISLAMGLGLDAMGRVLSRVADALYGLFLAVVIGGGLLLAWPLALLLPRGARVHRLSAGVSRLLLRLAGFGLAIEGALPETRPLLLVANHASYLDIPVLLALLPLDFVFVAKHEVLRWPIVATFVRRALHITVDRGDKGQSLAAADAVADAVRAGKSVLVFPEGTFTRAAGLRPFRLGAFRTAIDTGVPLVPLALRGTRRALPADAFIPRRGSVTLFVGVPVSPRGGGWAGAVALRDEVQGTIAAHCGEPLLRMLAGGVPES